MKRAEKGASKNKNKDIFESSSESEASDESDFAKLAQKMNPQKKRAKIEEKKVVKEEVKEVKLVTNGGRLTVILDQVCLETALTLRGVELLNPDDHYRLIKYKMKRDLEEFRPDLVHQALLALLDSPLNKFNKL